MNPRILRFDRAILQTKMAPQFILGALFLLACAVVSFAGTPNIYFDVKELKVSFVGPKKIRVSGMYRGRGISRIPSDDPSSGISVEANIDFLQDDSTFSLVPTGWVGRMTRGSFIVFEKNPYDAHWYHRGRKYYQKNTKTAIYTTNLRPGPSIIEKTLDEDRDDGRWFSFDRTLDFERVLAKNRRKYRVIIGLTYDFTAELSSNSVQQPDLRYFQQKYWWVVYGPFDWGVAPACNEMLTARHGFPVSFTSKGAAITELPVLEDKGGDAKTDGVKPPVIKTKRKKLVRPPKRPTQLQAVDAASVLQVKLNALPGVTASTIGLPPSAALLNISYADGLEPEELTRLVSDIAVETAYAAPWVESVRMSVNGGRGSTSIVINWNVIAAFANGETTYKEFFLTWEVSGNALTAPAAD